MIVLGILLIAAAAAFGVELFVSNNQTEVVGEAFGQSITRLSQGGYFLLGSAATVALFFGVLLLDLGLRRGRRKRDAREKFESRQLEVARQAQSEKAAAVSEAEKLREELVEERMSQATLGGVVPPPDVNDDAPPAAPVDDPEHAEDDHRGVLGRIRGDRSERAASRTAKAAAAGAREPATADGDDGEAPAGVVPQAQTVGGATLPRPEAATDAFNAALAPSERERRPAG